MARRMVSGKIVIGAAIVLALVAAALWPRAVPVETVAVSRGDVEVTIATDGTTRVRDRFVDFAVINPDGRLVAVIDLDPGGPKSKAYYLVNPRIVETSKEQSKYNEGCLSVPEVWDDVRRPAKVTVEYMDEKGRTQRVSADGLFATCLQHEIDHINGLLFIDHLSKLKRSIALRKSAKLKRRG